MLEGLDRIDWQRLKHAYGPASDVPDFIRGLASTQEAIRESAYEELCASIVHQGTVYEASAQALPFLIDLLAAPNTPQRDALALLVANILAGRGYCEVHFAKSRTNPFTGAPVPPSFDVDAQLVQERRIVAEIRRIGSRAIPLLLPYLSHPAADVRVDIARAVAWYPAFALMISQALSDALAVEHDLDARETMQAALDELQRGPG